MQPRSNLQIIRVAVLFKPLWIVALISGCAPIPAPVATSQPAIPGDPVLAFVSSGGIGQTASVNDPADGGIVNVDIETQYNSAAGQICRTFTLANSIEHVQRLACDDGATWRVVPPLINASN
jgi:hypothetical protein